MADSDGEFIADDLSDDDLADHQVTRGGRSDHSDDALDDGLAGAGARHSRRAARRRKKQRDAQASWETVKRSWDAVDEGEDGRLTGIEFLEAERRRRLLRDTTPLQRGIIRHVMLVLDMSFAMATRDYLPTTWRATAAVAVDFVREFFEQNPISQLGIVGMRDGVAVRVSDMGGNPAEHIEKLREYQEVEPQGNPSLQNALEMCRGALFHAPSHGTREVLVVFGALLSSDPSDIHDTISSLLTDRIQVSIVGLAAQVAICSEICSRTNPGSSDGGSYAVALDALHMRELVLAFTTPPVTRTAEQAAAGASLLMMGFPSRALELDASVSLCACHSRPTREGYHCTRCGSKVCRLPAECPACGLVLILSTHLARSYHHLFPLRNWVEVSWAEARRSRACYACLTLFPEVPSEAGGKSSAKGKEKEGEAATNGAAAVVKLKGVSESGRYACEVCGNHFCIDCDVYAHEVVHNCPGCQSDTRGHLLQDPAAAMETNGTNGAMVIDS